MAGIACDYGVRKRVVHILSGSVLLVWADVEQILDRSAFNKEVKMQVIRVRGSNLKVIGLLIPNNCVEEVQEVLLKPVEMDGEKMDTVE